MQAHGDGDIFDKVTGQVLHKYDRAHHSVKTQRLPTLRIFSFSFEMEAINIHMPF